MGFSSSPWSFLGKSITYEYIEAQPMGCVTMYLKGVKTVDNPTFQKRQYEKTAATLARVRRERLVNANEAALLIWQDTVDEFINMFYRDNNSFKPSKFREACNH